MTGFYGLETTLHNGIIQIVGDPIFAGILVLMFYGGGIMLGGTRLDGKMAILPGAIILASVVLPPFVLVLFTFGFGVVLAYGLWRIARQ